MIEAKEQRVFRQRILKLITLLVFPVALAVGFYMRLAFSPYLTYHVDRAFWLDWGHRIVDMGFSHFYDNSDCDYMPFTPMLFGY